MIPPLILHLIERISRKGIAAIFGSTVLYVALFLMLFDTVGSILAALALLPASVMAWYLAPLLGARASVPAGLWAIFFNSLLFLLVGQNPISSLVGRGAWLGTLMILLVGAMVGWLRAIIEERTRLATQLRTVAEVSLQLNTVHDTELLLEKTVNLLQSRFDLYHVHLYLLDESEQTLRIRVGSGEAGQQLRERHHRIALDSEVSLVARAARTRHWVLANDVRSEATFLPNPLLPNTRAELALPLISLHRLLGVLDVQDDRPQRFSQEEVDTFNVLAGQIATALENAQLFKEVNSNLDSMQHAAERLREVDRLKSEFLANMSHELRTPLNSIIGFTEILLMGLDGPLNDAANEDISAIRSSSYRLLYLINDVLDLAKIEAGRMTLEKDYVMVRTLLETLRRNHESLLRDKPVSIEIEVQAELPLLWADPLRLTQIMTNLLSNAIKFTEEGAIWLRAYRDGETICLAVEDSGIGMTQADLATIFEQFSQVDRSQTRRAGGTGLGLAITRHLTAMHEGEIRVQSELGKGSTFTVCLPHQEMESPPSRTHERTSASL